MLTVSDGTIAVGAQTGTTVTLMGTAAEIDKALATTSYTGNSNFYGTDTLSVMTTDNGGQSTTQTATITVADTAVIGETVTPVNGPENTLIPLSVSVSDSNTGDASLTTVLTVSDGTITVGAQTGSTVTLTGTAAAIDAELASASYTGNSNFYGTDTLSVMTTDGGGQSTTQAVTITVADTAVIGETVTPVNGPENTLIPLSVSVSDSNTGDASLTTVLTVSDGTITVGAQTGSTVTLTGTAAAIDAELASASYTGNSNFYGTDTLSVMTTDGGGQSTTQAATITVADTAVIGETVTPVNGPENTLIPLSVSVSDSTPGMPR